MPVTGSASAPAKAGKHHVPAYRAFKLDKRGKIVETPYVMECEDDTDALIWAQQYVDGRAVEIWEGARRVALIPADD